MKRLQLLYLLFFFSGFVFAQDYNMQNGTITTCSGNFYDAGGPTGNYANSTDYTMTIVPSTAGQGIRLTFTSFALESVTWDYLSIYDGPTTASQLIGTFGGTTSPGIIETSFANTSGNLTLKFHSDSSIVYAGWSATIECFTPIFVEQYIMSNNGSATTCSGVFYDGGGQYGNYANSANMVYTINPGTAGQSVQLNFTSLNIEESYDRLYIYDGTSITSPLIAILSGTPTVMPVITASAANTSGSLTLRFTSDSVINRPGWAASISCVTPSTTNDVYIMHNGSISACNGTFYDTGGLFGYYNDNENNTLTFCSSMPNQSIAMSFSSFNLASGDVLNIYDGDTTSAPLIGNFTGTSIPASIQASYENTSGCLTVQFVSNSSTIRPGWVASLSCFIPTVPNEPEYVGCSVLTVSEDDSVGCNGGPCTEIEATVGFDVIGGGMDTSSYTISNVNCPLEITPGTPVSVNIDDRWSNVINIGFTFSFFGNTYNQLLIGSNGVVTFNLDDADDYCPWSFSASAPSEDLITNAIFGAYHDIDPSVCGEISYSLTGTAPYRAFVINFNEVCHFSCNSLKTSQHIILYESSNIIDVYIDNKPTCTTWNSGNALIGIQNIDGTIAYVPEGRNTGPWSTSNEQWRFVPEDEFEVEYNFEWLDEAGEIITNDLSFIACPTQNTSYTAHLTYTLYGVDYEREETVNVTFTGNTTVTANQPEDLETCLKDGAAVFDITQVESEVVGVQTDVTVSYYTSEGNADTQTNPISNAQAVFFAVNQDFVIWVRIDDNITGCYALTNFTLHIVPEDEYPITQPGNLIECENVLNSQIGTFDLTQQTNVINSGFNENSVTYYLSQADAESGTSAITNLSSFNNISNPQTIYARLENLFGCFNTTSFNISTNTLPSTNETLSQSNCNSGNGTTVFDLPNISGYTTHYYVNQADALAGNSNFITNTSTYTSTAGTIYLNLTNPNTLCQNVFNYTLGVYALPTATQPTIAPSCNIGNGFGIFDIEALITTIEGSQSGVVVTFHPTQADADAGTNVFTSDWSEFTTVERTVYARVENDHGCYATTSFFLDVYNCVPTIPNGFSPNGDDINDLLTVVGLKDVFTEFKFTVFNRWGNVVCEKNNSNTSFVAGNTGAAILWDGSVDGVIASDPEAATYFFTLELNDGENGPINNWIYVNP
jgi:gliding motility-associated-like protein